MKRIFAVLGLALALAAPAYGLEPEREGQDTFISRAVFAQGKLWVLTDAGQVFFIEEGKPNRTKVNLPEPANELWVTHGQAMVATCERSRCSVWTIRQFDGTSWRTTTSVAALRKETLRAIVGVGTQTMLLTSLRIILVTDKDQKILKFAEPLFNDPPKDPYDYGRITSVLVRPDRIYFGLNAGEWGGGLWTIDRKTGRVASVGDKPIGKSGTVISTGLDPVNALVEEPWKPGCFVAAIGLVHFGPNGRLAEVCGNDVNRLYYRNLRNCDEKGPQPTTPGIPRCIKEDGELLMEEEAFFDLARQGDAIWAAGIDGLYKISANGVERTGSLPKFDAFDGTCVSFAIPGIALVLTEINRRASVSGAAPMIVSKDNP
jgi:hypothetical protein